MEREQVELEKFFISFPDYLEVSFDTLIHKQGHLLGVRFAVTTAFWYVVFFILFFADELAQSQDCFRFRVNIDVLIMCKPINRYFTEKPQNDYLIKQFSYLISEQKLSI